MFGFLTIISGCDDCANDTVEHEHFCANDIWNIQRLFRFETNIYFSFDVDSNELDQFCLKDHLVHKKVPVGQVLNGKILSKDLYYLRQRRGV